MLVVDVLSSALSWYTNHSHDLSLLAFYSSSRRNITVLRAHTEVGWPYANASLIDF